MSEKNYISGVSSSYSDGNLIVKDSIDLGGRILIIGTATRGPINTPVRVTDVETAIDIFGPVSNTNQETLLTAFLEVLSGPGGTKDITLVRISNGDRATISIPEIPQSGTEARKALTLTALYPGEIYNYITISSVINDGKNCISILNPISGEISYFPYNTSSETTSDIKDIEELARAIMNDPNLNGIMEAKVEDFIVNECIISFDNSYSDFVETNDSYTTIKLGALFEEKKGDGYVVDGDKIFPAETIPYTSAKNIKEIDVWQNIEVEESLDSAGLEYVGLKYPVQYGEPLGDVLGSGVNVAVQVVDKANIGVSDGQTTDYAFTAYETIDTETFALFRMTAQGEIREVEDTDYNIIKTGGSEYNNVAQVVFLTGKVPQRGESILISYQSVGVDMVPEASLASCLATEDYKHYFLAGDRIYFGAACPTDMKIKYAARKIYVQGETAFIMNRNTDIRINDKLDTTEGFSLSLSWRYLPTWIEVNTVSYSLRGGSNGSVFSNAEKYKLLANAYEALGSYEFDYLYVPKTYIDDTKIEYSTEDGLPIEVNAGFARQMENFLTGLQVGWTDAIGFIGTKPIEDGNVNTWYNKLVATTSLYDAGRAANIMAARDYKHLVVCPGNLLATNDYKGSYVADMPGIYLGMLAHMPISQTLMNKEVRSSMLLNNIYYIDMTKIKAIQDAGYTMFKVDNNGTLKICEANTAAAPGSDYKRLSSMRTATACVNAIRSVSDPFIGQLYSAAVKTAHETAIQSALFKIQESGALRYFNFNLTQTESQRVKGEVDVDLELGPEFELCKIFVKVKLTNTNTNV